jgi:hypothetical protein
MQKSRDKWGDIDLSAFEPLTNPLSEKQDPETTEQFLARGGMIEVCPAEDDPATLTRPKIKRAQKRGSKYG